MQKKLFSYRLQLLPLFLFQYNQWHRLPNGVVDKGHSNVKFTVTHYAVSEVEGNFQNF